MLTTLIMGAILASGPTASEGTNFLRFAEQAEDREYRFDLFNECQGMDLVVEDLHENAGEIGLTKESIQAATESRLRSARLYNPDHLYAYLYVNVNVIGPAYSIDIEFKKWLHDLAMDRSGIAATWNTGSTGTHGNGASYIVSNVSRHMDQFLVEYLRANEDYC